MKKIIVLLFVSIFFLSSCATSIISLKKDPSKYAGQVVLIKGEVTKLIKIPFTDYSFFEIKDKTDNILVFSVNDNKIGDLISIKCKVVAYDSTDEVKSTQLVIDNIEEFLIKNIKLDEVKLKKVAKNIGESLSKALKMIQATYLLIEQVK